MSQKVELEPPRKKYGWIPPNSAESELKKSLPFFKSSMGELVHRVRRGTIYWRGGNYSHTALNFWCGGNGFPGKKGTLLRVCQRAKRFVRYVN